MIVQLGSLVMDNVSGFTGVVVAEHKYLNGCTRMTVQPRAISEGKLPRSETFDELQLRVIEGSPNVPIGNTITGGPSEYEDKGR